MTEHPSCCLCCLTTRRQQWLPSRAMLQGGAIAAVFALAAGAYAFSRPAPKLEEIIFNRVVLLNGYERHCGTIPERFSFEQYGREIRERYGERSRAAALAAFDPVHISSIIQRGMALDEEVTAIGKARWCDRTLRGLEGRFYD
jgi:hypothetical protein